LIRPHTFGGWFFFIAGILLASLISFTFAMKPFCMLIGVTLAVNPTAAGRDSWGTRCHPEAAAVTHVQAANMRCDEVVIANCWQ
jgi:hypothetical protein